MALLNLLEHLGHARHRLRRGALLLEEIAELLALLLCVRRVPGDVCGLALEEVGHEDLVLVLLVGVCEDVGALQRLGEEAEDVVDEEDGGGGTRWAGDVWRIV